MAENTKSASPTMKPTLGLTGLTFNAMALIAPGAFLWLTYEEQALYGAPMAGSSMWFGFLMALLLCFATAISYAELSKLYPGAGSAYYYAEQAFMSRTKYYKFARVVKFFTGWASHLYYWVYPGLMVGVTALLVGYLAGIIWPDTFTNTYNSPVLMILVCIVFAPLISWIASRGVTGSTVVNVIMNVVQIAALLVFSIMAIGYRMNHKEGSQAIHFSGGGTAINYMVEQVGTTSSNVTADLLDPTKNKDTDLLGALKDANAKVGDPLYDYQKNSDGTYNKDDKGKLQLVQVDRTVADEDLDKTKNKDADVLAALTTAGLATGDPYPLFKNADGTLNKDKDGKLAPVPFTISYTTAGGGITGTAGDAKNPQTFNYHPTAASVVSPHGFSNIIVQACIAILCLVGFESVSSMGEEAKNPKKDIPKAILMSLAIQGAFCYLIEYFCANYFLNSGYTMVQAGASSAPIGDMMRIVGMAAFGSASAGQAFMLVQAATVFLALIGTTLACLNTGARVTYAMGRDEEVGAHFGLLHEKTLTPHKAIWTLGILSIFIGIITVLTYLASPSATLTALDPKYAHSFWYSFGIFSPSAYTWLPNTFVIVTLISNFGTFLLYMTTCVVAIVAFQEHHTFSGFKHFVVPVFGVLANGLCMLYYLIGPLPVNGSSLVANMSWHEPYIALGVVALWGAYGLFYFAKGSKKKGKEIFLTEKPVTSA